MNRSAICGWVILAMAVPAFAIDSDEPLADPQQQALYETLTAEVRCLVCQNQTVGDSTAPLAADLRREIRAMVEAGQDEAEIKTFLTERYGDFVLYRPRYTGPAAVLWATPVVLLILGGIVLWRILRRRASLPVPAHDDVSEGGGA